MPIGYSAPEDIINAALRECGYPTPIAEIYEGSRAANVAVEVYGTARDFLLQQHDWDFATGETLLTPTVGGALILGFAYEYNYPPDALRIRAVHVGIPVVNDPQPVRWLPGNDFVLGTRVIYATVAGALAVYVKQITDPAKWNAGFTRAFVGLLSRIFASALRDEINLVRTRSQLSDQTTAEASSVGDGMPPIPPELLARAAAAAQPAR